MTNHDLWRTADLEDGGTEGVTNDERADLVENIVRIHAVFGNADENDFKTGVKDALTNLMHFCRRENLIFAEVLQAAESQHDEERHDWKNPNKS